jgi:fucose permease
MTAVALAGFSASGRFIFLCLCAVPLGLGAGSVDAALNNYVALNYKARHMSWLHCFWGVGTSIGPIIMSSFLLRQRPWNLGYRTIGIIQFCLAALLFVSLPLWKKNKSGGSPAEHSSKGISDLFRINGVKEALLTFFCYCSLETVTGLWGASFLVMVKGIQPEIAARWISLYYIGITFGRFVSGFITMKMSNRMMVRLGLAILACGIVVLVLPLGNAVLLPGLFLIGAGCAPIYPSLIHETPRNFGEENSQAIIGLQMASAYTGTSLVPPLFGRLASFTGLKIFPLFIGIILLVMIITVETLNRKTDNKRARRRSVSGE